MVRFPLTRLFVLIVIATTLTGCNTNEENDIAGVLQTALTDFTQNRSLSEQFVRDVKSRLAPSDPAYVQAMESYQDARDTYNAYLDAVETGEKNSGSRSMRSATPQAVENSAADFIADASRALRPNEARHRGDFQRSITVPERLQNATARLPKNVRQKLADKFDDQIRWRSWSAL